MNELGKRIEKLREARKMGRSELAREAGMDYSNLYRIERKGGEPRFNTLEKIAIALGMEFALSAQIGQVCFAGSPGELLQWAMQQAGLSMFTFAQLAHVDRRNLKQYERGEVCPLPSSLDKLLGCCGAEMRFEFRERPPTSFSSPSPPTSPS